MKIATWNVNSVRTRLEQIKDWLANIQPDLLCLQETKVEDALFPHKAFEEIGYQVSFYGQKAYNGVALISKIPLEDIRMGFEPEIGAEEGIEEFSDQKRVISALIEGIRVVNVYVPNGSDLKSDKYTYKLKWLKFLKEYLNSQSKREEPLCIVGDFNIALEDKDIHSPERLTGGIMASQPERLALKNVLGERLKDVFRVFELDTNHWSWWDYRSGAWARDRGWRIDHIYLSDDLIKLSKSCFIDKKTRGNEKPSDHAPVIVEINWPLFFEEDEIEQNYN